MTRFKGFWIFTLVLFSGWALPTRAFSDPAGQLSFEVALNPAGSFVAKSSSVAGDVVAKGGGFEASEISLPLASLKTGIELRDKHMVQNYFEAAKFPKAVLTQAVGKDGKFRATLSIHGKSQSIEGEYEVKGSGAGESLEAKFKTSLSAFSIKEANYMGVGVEDEVQVTALIPVRKAAKK